MEFTKVVFNNTSNGEIQLFSDDTKIGLMDISIRDGRLTVFHTEVSDAFKGRGFAKLLLDGLTNYAKEIGARIVPLCPYVRAEFMRHPETYNALWYKEDK